MNNEELKKKIMEVVNQWHMFQNRDMHGHTIWLTNDSEKLANALISAGIGDVKEAEHRALVAERALKILIKNQYSRCAVPTELCSGIGCRSNECQKIILEYYLQQAKKELAEERKDEQMR